MQNYLERGVLNGLDLAFSRDQQQKIYVQHRIQEQAAKFYDWLEQGAYICGNTSYMAADVEKAILHVIQNQGQMPENEALQYLSNLKKENRLLKDVY